MTEPTADPPWKVLAEWAWARENLLQLQRAYKAIPTPAIAALIPPAIVENRRALRRKKALDTDNKKWHAKIEWMICNDPTNLPPEIAKTLNKTQQKPLDEPLFQ